MAACRSAAPSSASPPSSGPDGCGRSGLRLLHHVAHPDGAGNHDLGVDAAQVELAADGRVHELQGGACEAGRELLAAAVGLGGHLDDSRAQLEPGAGWQVLAAEVEVEV